MSDDDRLTDYLRRTQGDTTPRTLSDGCGGCGLSVVSCQVGIYMDLGKCCGGCDGHGG